MKFLVTGVAGFIGFHLARRLVEQGHEVVGIDNLNPYYDVTLRLHRQQRSRLSERAGGGKKASGSTSGLRFLHLGVWAGPARSLQRYRRRRPSCQPVRHEAVERADGAQLLSPVRYSYDRPAVLHRLRPVGSSRHGTGASRRSLPPPRVCTISATALRRLYGTPS